MNQSSANGCTHITYTGLKTTSNIENAYSVILLAIAEDEEKDLLKRTISNI